MNEYPVENGLSIGCFPQGACTDGSDILRADIPSFEYFQIAQDDFNGGGYGLRAYLLP